MPDIEELVPLAQLVELPAVYSQGGFVQVRTVILQPDTAIMPNGKVANDKEPSADLLSAS
jgi:hypothetical protein